MARSLLRASLALAGAVVFAVSCGGKSDILYQGPVADGGFAGGAGGQAGTAGSQASTGGSSGNSSGGTGGSGTGGSGTGGSGTGGSGTAGGGPGGSAGATTCDPAFCPDRGFGTPCCRTPEGPCGIDFGGGCFSGGGGSGP